LTSADGVSLLALRKEEREKRVAAYYYFSGSLSCLLKII
jgi:hypothetical protein